MHPRASLRAALACVLPGAAALAALTLPCDAAANPGLEGMRNLGLGGASRASASGVQAFFANPAGMSLTRTLAIESDYQATVERNSHGFGVTAVDSMNSPRVALGLGYSFLRGYPSIGFEEVGGDGPRELTLTHSTQEVGLGLSILVVKRWLSIGVKPKYQSLSLRAGARGGDGVDARRDVIQTQHAFGLDVGATLSILQWVNVAVVGHNLTGATPPAYTDETSPDLAPYEVVDGSFDPLYLPRVSDYARTLGHGVAVFPLRSLRLSLNFDGAYDFTSYADLEHVRKTFAGGGEYVLGKFAMRIGGGWDGRGPGDADDRGYIAGGFGVIKTAEAGKVGVLATLGFRRDLTGPLPETVLGANFSVLFNPGF
ncbi:MAG: hypothetical protein R3A79_01455 [Nannocystaceae bacterium]